MDILFFKKTDKKICFFIKRRYNINIQQIYKKDFNILKLLKNIRNNNISEMRNYLKFAKYQNIVFCDISKKKIC